MSMNIRTFLAILLSFLVVFVYQYFFAKNLETQKQEQAQTQTQAQPGQQQAAAPAAVPGAPAVKAPAAAPVAKAAPAARDIRVETPLYTAVFSTRGGALKSFKLKEYKATLEENSPLIEMVQVQEGSELPLATGFADSSVNLAADIVYEADRKELDLTKDAKPGTARFQPRLPRPVPRGERSTPSTPTVMPSISKCGSRTTRTSPSARISS